MPEPSLDNWTIIFLLAAAQGIFLAVILFLKAKQKARFILGIIVLLFSVSLIDYVAFWTGYRFIFPHINRISTTFPFLFGPLFYFYVKVFFDVHKLSIKDVFHLFPFLIYLIIQLPYYLQTGAVKVDMLINRDFFVFENGFLLSWEVYINSYAPIVMVLHLLLYIVLVFRLISERDLEKVADSASRWIRVLQYSFLGFVLSFASYYVMVYLFSYNLSYDYAISVAMSFFIYGIGYFGYMSPEVMSGSIDEHLEKEKYSNSGLTEQSAKELKEKLTLLMEKDKVYLKSDLKLIDLAIAVNESKHHVSQVINDELNTSFSFFVNEYRIKQSQKLLEDKSQHLNMFGIARESGFNNKTTFSLAFKRHTGLTPSSYKEKNLQ